MKPTTKWCLVGLGVIFAIAIIKQENVEASPDGRRDKYCGRNHDGRFAAYFYSKRFVEKRLKAPASAEFGGFDDDGVSSQWVMGCEFMTEGFVDAQNSFGATIRNRYKVALEYLPEQNIWQTSDVEISPY